MTRAQSTSTSLSSHTSRLPWSPTAIPTYAAPRGMVGNLLAVSLYITNPHHVITSEHTGSVSSVYLRKSALALFTDSFPPFCRQYIPYLYGVYDRCKRMIDGNKNKIITCHIILFIPIPRAPCYHNYESNYSMTNILYSTNNNSTTNTVMKGISYINIGSINTKHGR